MSEEDKQKLAEAEALKAKLAEAEAKLASATGELIEGRKSKAELEADRDALKVKLAEAEAARQNAGNPPAPEEVVRKVLKEKEVEDAKSNLKAAEEAFKAQVKDFSPDNDPGGIKFSAVKEKFARFNLEGIVKTEDFLTLFAEAATLANPSKPVIKQQYTPYAATPPKDGSGPREADTNTLTSQENDIVNRLGWTKEKYLEQKAKRPHYVESLLKNLV